MSMFHVGQRVVCVNDAGLRIACDLKHMPVAGLIYTIREFKDVDGPGFLLEEIVNDLFQYSYGMDEPYFCATRFHPVKNTSIEVFRKLLAPMPEKADA